MNYPTEEKRLSIEQVVGRLHARTLSELRLLNEHLPQSMRLERMEIDRLADDLLFAVRETPKRRNASLFHKAVWMASDLLVHATRQRSRRRNDVGALAHWNRQAVHEAGHSKGDSDALPAPLAQGHSENLGTGLAGANNRNRVA